MDLNKVQAYLKNQQLDGWLLIDFHGRNEIAVKALNLEGHLSRRAVYYIPAEGDPVALLNPIEASKFSHLPGEKIIYRGYAGYEEKLARLLKGVNKVAMEYAPKGRLPYIGIVDAGTIELVREHGVEIVPSSDLVADFYARLSPAQIARHREAATIVNGIKDEAFARIARHLKDKTPINEYEVVQFILERFAQENLIPEYDPNCSVDSNAADGHYTPTAESAKAIVPGSIVLIDLWARHDHPDGVFADMTWMAYAGTADQIPDEYRKVFSILTEARDTAVAFLQEQLPLRSVCGYEADDACRAVIDQAGYGEHFKHRTGHSITSNIHGEGPNIDNLETEDNRALRPGHLFSIEPGIYPGPFGMRTEINCLVTESGAEVTTLPLQKDILPLL